MAPRNRHEGHHHHSEDYLKHFFKFVATFAVIVCLSLFLFAFISGT